MTKVEAAALAARLVQIWTPSRKLQNQWDGAPSLEYAEWDIVGHQFQFLTYVQEDVLFLYIDPAKETTKDERWLQLNRSIGKKTTGELDYQGGRKRLIQCSVEDSESNALWVEFGAAWMPFFRRGCWLSGCHVEASAHEKAQWMEGFAREEIEGWNLNF